MQNYHHDKRKTHIEKDNQHIVSIFRELKSEQKPIKFGIFISNDHASSTPSINVNRMDSKTMANLKYVLIFNAPTTSDRMIWPLLFTSILTLSTTSKKTCKHIKEVMLLHIQSPSHSVSRKLYSN